MTALQRFVAWLAEYAFSDRNKRLPANLRLQYHSRSDVHSKKLGELIVDDLLNACSVMREQAERGEIAYSINHVYEWPNGKAKTLDIAIGVPLVERESPAPARIHRLKSQSRVRKTSAESLSRLLLTCEEKAVMTEHGKSQPRVYSELNDAHTIVHSGSRDTISAGITMVNIAAHFVSPLRQRPEKDVEISDHDQPHVTESMVMHLRRLPIRESTSGVGLDACCTFVVNVDNMGHVSLQTSPPAPQPGDPDHYGTFIGRLSRLYTERYGDLRSLPAASELTVEESLVGLAQEHPGLLTRTGQLAVDEQLEGAPELQAILDSVEQQANPTRDQGIYAEHTKVDE